MEESRLVAVSPSHTVRLASGYLHLLDRAPQSDFVVRTIERREVEGLPLMSAEIVIASRATRERHPLAHEYPLHFRKSYFPGRLRVDPAIEFERTASAAACIRAPLPIGFERGVYRSCLVPGTPYRRLSPFDFEPEESNIPRAVDLPLATAAGLWRLLEEAYAEVMALHAAGIAHCDLELQNMIVCPSPLEVVLVDFERAILRDSVDAVTWEQRCRDDALTLLRDGVLLQVSLGRQRGEFAEQARARIPDLFRHPDRFCRAIALSKRN
jgi:hypothetical protein